MKITIIGGGSIGLHIAASLHLKGKRATVVCRTDRQAREIERQGLRYTQLDQSVQTVFAPARSIEEAPPETDWIFLTVKQTSLLSTIRYLKLFQPNTPVLCFQNGIGHDETLKTHAPDLPVFYAITTEGAYRSDARSVRHTGKGDTFVGALDECECVKPLERLVAHLSDADLGLRIAPNIEERLWKKLIINSCINPLTALLRVKNGELLENEHTVQAIKQLLNEAVAFVRLRGIEIEGDFMQEIVRVCRNTYENKSSMLQDVEAGRETEIEYINGAIARMAGDVGISAPAHALLTKLVLSKSQSG